MWFQFSEFPLETAVIESISSNLTWNKHLLQDWVFEKVFKSLKVSADRQDIRILKRMLIVNEQS